MALDHLVDDTTVYVSKLDSFEFCPYAAYLDTFVYSQGLPMTGWMAMGNVFRESIRLLLPKKKHVGPELKHVERLTPEELAGFLYFHESGGFARRALAEKWLGDVINKTGKKNGKVNGRAVVWTSEDDAHKFSLGQFYNKCRFYYEHLAEHGLPFLGYMHKEIAFMYERRKYVVRFDEIRQGMEIGIYMNRKPNTDIHTNWRVTLLALALSQMVAWHDHYALKFGASEQFVRECRRWSIHPDIKFVYHYANLVRMQENGKKKKVAVKEDFETRREFKDLVQLMQEIRRIKEGMKTAVSTGKFEPNQKNCSACRYNVATITGAPVCDARDSSTPLARVIPPPKPKKEADEVEKEEKEWFE